MNAVFEARSRRGIETTGFCIVFEGSKSLDVTLANEQLLWKQSHNGRMRGQSVKYINEGLQQLNEGCLILAISGRPGFCQDGMNITG